MKQGFICILSLLFIYYTSNSYASTNTSVLNFASYILTQNALTDAPERYSKFIQDAIDYANNQTLTIAPYCDSHCCSKFEVTINNKLPKFSLFEPNGIILTINKTGFSVWTKWNVHINLVIFARIGDYMAWPLYDCWWTWTLCRSTTGNIIGSITASMNVDVSWNKILQILTIIPNIPTLAPSLKFSTDCDTADFVDDIFNIYSKIDKYMNMAIMQEVNIWSQKILQKFNVPQTFKAYSGVRITYYVIDLTFNAKQWAKISANGYLEAQDPSTGKWLKYIDNVDDANMAPPIDWPWSKTINTNDERLWLLNGLRVSSSLLTALVWAADTIGELTPVYNFTALDATIIFNLTWSKPLLSIPKNNVLEAIMGYGIVNGTCYETALGPPQHNQTVIISFYFINLIGSATVSLQQHQNNVSLAIQIVDFNVSALHPVLIKPKLPLPPNVIANMLSVLVNSSIPLINAYLIENAMIIPAGFSQWIPHPQLTLVHQDGCCNGQHGYMQFYSLCSCDENNPLWTECSQLPCSPTPKPTQSPTTTTTPTNSVRRLATNNYDIWINVYSSTVQETSSCDLTKTGDVGLITLLQNTNGKCMQLSPYLNEAARYYSLTMSASDKINDIRLLCNAQCSACKWPSVDHEEIKIGNCYQFTYTSAIMLLKSSDNICIGGNIKQSQIDNNKNVIVMTYNGSSICNAEYSDLVMIQNMGDILLQCVESINIPNEYSTFDQFEMNDTVFYNLGINCSINVQQNHCEKCKPLYLNLEYNTCFQSNKPNTSMKFIFANDTSICGGNTSSTQTKWSTQDIWIAVLVSIIIILLSIMLFCSIYRKRVIIRRKCDVWKELCITRCDRPHIDCTPIKRCCYDTFIGSLINFKNWILNGIDSPKNIYNRMTKRLKLHNWLLLIASILILIEMIAWLYESPWNIFNRESFDEIGIPSDVLDINNLETILIDWEYFAECYFGIFAFIIMLLLVIRFTCKRKIFCWEWYKFRVLLLLIYIFIVFIGIFLFIPTFYEFRKMVQLNPKNENTFTASSDIEDIVNEMIGYSFVAVFLSYFSNVLLYWMHTIPAGVYLASLFFIYFLFEEEEDDDFERMPHIQAMDNNNIDNGDEDSKRKLCFCCCFMELECKMQWRCTNRVYVILKDIFKYKINKDLKATMIARIIVIVFLLQAMATCIESLPVIIMYQSFGSNIGWLFAWIIWWTLPICLLGHLWWSCNQYIKQLRGESQFNAIRSQKHLIFNAIMEVITFLIVLVTSIVTESQKTQIAVWFLILTCCAALIISGILWAFILHFMFVNTKIYNIQNLMDDEDDLSEAQHSETELTVNSKINDGIIEYVEEEKYSQLNESNQSNESNITLEMDHYNTGYTCFWFLWCLCEKREIRNPYKYGERVRYRRIFLWIGVPSYGYVVIKNFVDIIGISVKQTIINFFSDLNMGVTWPNDDEGGTLFDSTFAVYNNARIWSASCSLIALFLLLLSLFSDCMMMEKRGLKISRIFGWLSILALLASTFTPSLPNYLSHTPIDSICPYCSPQFTNAIYLLFGDIVGLFCSGLFTINMLPILVIAVIPAIARASYMVLHSYKIYKLDLNEQDTVRYIFICGSFLAPFTTFAPLLVYQQFMGDIVVSVLLFIFWILPIFIAININAKNSTIIYYQYIGTYYILLIIIFAYHIGVYGIPHWLQVLIYSPHWWIETILEICGEWCLTNIILSDFLYAILMGLRTKHYNHDERQHALLN